MKSHGLCAALFAVFASQFAAVLASQGSEDRFVPYPVVWEDVADCAIDLSFLLDKPAGKDGFITVQDGHFVTPTGKRLRFWGVNFSSRGGLPPKEHAPIIADRLARLGVNCVRFHFFDRLAPDGIIDAARDDTRQFDPSRLDQLDFFIAQLKERGIYSDVNLNVARTYKSGDGVKDYQLLGFAKALTYFDPRLLELQREYAQKLLTHRNPYTGNEYRHEPAVALIEFVNENSLIEAWMDGRLRGTNTQRNPGTWTDIPASYAEDLTRLYNDWLKKNVDSATLEAIAQEAGVEPGQAIPRLKPDEFNKASAQRFHTEARFYMEIEREYFTKMKSFLRDEIGVKQLIIGNSDHGHSHSGYPIVATTSLLDVVDGHVYWQHPSYIRDPKTGRTLGFKIPNTPMVVDPLHSTVVQLARTPVLNKPYTVSEVNHPFPHQYACEGIPVLAAYASFQDWDGIFWYTMAHREVVGTEPRIAGHFDLAFDPVKLTQLAAGSLAFLRGDVQKARQVVTRSYTAEQVRESIRLQRRWELQPFFTPGFPLAMPLQHAVRVSSFVGPPTQEFEPIDENPIRSDTGEITWWTDGKRGLVVIDSPRWQAIVGHCGGAANNGGLVPETKNLALGLTTPFAGVTLASLDQQSIAGSQQLLLTTCAQVANTGQRWNDEKTTLEDWGAAPTVIERVHGTVILRNMAGKKVTVQPLDAQGRPMATAYSAEEKDGAWRIVVAHPTTWYLITIQKR